MWVGWNRQQNIEVGCATELSAELRGVPLYLAICCRRPVSVQRMVGQSVGHFPIISKCPPWFQTLVWIYFLGFQEIRVTQNMTKEVADLLGDGEWRVTASRGLTVGIQFLDTPIKIWYRSILKLFILFELNLTLVNIYGYISTSIKVMCIIPYLVHNLPCYKLIKL